MNGWYSILHYLDWRLEIHDQKKKKNICMHRHRVGTIMYSTIHNRNLFHNGIDIFAKFTKPHCCGGCCCLFHVSYRMLYTVVNPATCVPFVIAWKGPFFAVTKSDLNPHRLRTFVATSFESKFNHSIISEHFSDYFVFFCGFIFFSVYSFSISKLIRNIHLLWH